MYVTKSNRDEEKSSRCGKYFCIFLGMAVILGGIAVAILVGGEESRACVFNRLCSCEYVNMWYCFFYQLVSSTRHPPPSRAKAAKKALPRPRRGPESAVYFIQIRHQLRISSHHNQQVKVRTYRCGARVYQR